MSDPLVRVIDYHDRTDRRVSEKTVDPRRGNVVEFLKIASGFERRMKQSRACDADASSRTPRAAS